MLQSQLILKVVYPLCELSLLLFKLQLDLREESVLVQISLIEQPLILDFPYFQLLLFRLEGQLAASQLIERILEL